MRWPRLTTSVYRKIIDVSAMITAVASVIVAILALNLSINESEERRRHEKLRFMPHIEWKTINSNVSGVEVFLSNNGIGPAKIKWFKAFQGTDELEDWGELVPRLGLPSDISVYRFSVFNTDTVLSPDDTEPRRILSLKGHNITNKILQDTHFVICFCSLLGDCDLSVKSSDVATISKLLKKLPSCREDTTYLEHSVKMTESSFFQRKE